MISQTTIAVLIYDDGNDDDRISWCGDVCCVALIVSFRLVVAVRDVTLNCPHGAAKQV